MCGRYVRKADRKRIAEWFEAEPNPSDLPMSDADYIVPPQQPTHHQAEQEHRRTRLILARWGLVPFCAKSDKI
ncbi:SOS response-associated peptidase family protein [Tunturiibacter gelidoferens]|uniref:SOS response-associated peptidase YedK n=1 Tax=Tunturiibacter gelidiferens TaxID=3069689 RepID=A0A9X0QJA3_9BACT|nr:putative SOS response-associated peptidase YedK [Edaphobacter lichenicola]